MNETGSVKELKTAIANEVTQLAAARPLLTIAIPTYNRARYLSESLAALGEQMRSESRVELLVSDNASTDETRSVIRKYMDAGLSIRLLTNDRNVGPDTNILQCFNEAKGKYVFILGDDDLIVPNGVSRILCYLESGEYDLVYLCPYAFERDYIAERETDRFQRSAAIIRDAAFFAKTVNVMFTFISANIVNKDRFLTLECPPLSNLDQTFLVQMGWILTLLRDHRKSLFVWERLIAGRKGNLRGWGIARVFGKNLKELTDAFLTDRPELAHGIINGTIREWFPGMIVAIRQNAAGDVEAEDIHSILRPALGNNYLYWLFIFPVLKLPIGLASLWVRLTLVLKKIIHAMMMLTGRVRYYEILRDVEQCR